VSRFSLTQLATLQAFVRTGTLAAAAESLGYTPGAVSQQVVALEKAYGARRACPSNPWPSPRASAPEPAENPREVLDAQHRPADQSVRSLKIQHDDPGDDHRQGDHLHRAPGLPQPDGADHCHRGGADT
jgi:hypothetical protein